MGLDVAMNERQIVRVLNGGRGITDYRASIVVWNLAKFSQCGPQIPTIHKLHNQKMDPTVFELVLSDFDCTNDVWVVKCGGRVKLALQTLENFGIVRKSGAQYLYSNNFSGCRVARLVDAPNAAFAEFVQQFVPANNTLRLVRIRRKPAASEHEC